MFNLIHTVFEERATQSPTSVALTFENRNFSYAQLNERADYIANVLIRSGVRRGTLVGLCMERSPEMVAGMLGILKAGGAYVPLDGEYPDERLAFMLRDTSVPVVVVDPSTVDRVARLRDGAKLVCLDAKFDGIESTNNVSRTCDATGDDLAYVMYTSGSTGVPKGVMVRHRGVIGLVRNTDYCSFSSSEVFLQLAPASFDASTFEIWGALLNGARLVIMPPGPMALHDLGTVIRRHGVTTVWLTAALFNVMVETRVDDLRPLRQLLTGGEAHSPRHIRIARDELEDGVLIHGYGPTECTTFATSFRSSKADHPDMGFPIGRPIAGAIARVLDSHLQPVAVGQAGELYLGGEGLAAGYLNQPDLTREKFVPDPFSSSPDGRLYRTGDLVRCRPDGNIDFLGRLDGQIKINGHRIEPGEIEATLQDHPAVSRAVVIAAQLLHGEPKLAAYVVGDGVSNLNVIELRGFLAARLPKYMLPNWIKILAHLPISLNGKVDRSSLPPPGPDEPCLDAAITSGDGMEGLVADVWGRVLARRVELDDNFFDLGGNSLELIEVHAELQRRLGTEIPITDLFDQTTVRMLAAHLARTADSTSKLTQIRERARRQREVFARQKQFSGEGK